MPGKQIKKKLEVRRRRRALFQGRAQGLLGWLPHWPLRKTPNPCAESCLGDSANFRARERSPTRRNLTGIVEALIRSPLTSLKANRTRTWLWYQNGMNSDLMRWNPTNVWLLSRSQTSGGIDEGIEEGARRRSSCEDSRGGVALIASSCRAVPESPRPPPPLFFLHARHFYPSDDAVLPVF